MLQSVKHPREAQQSFPLNKYPREASLGQCQNLQVLMAGASGSLCNEAIGNFSCDCWEKRCRKRESRKSWECVLSKNLYLGLISHAWAEWRIFFPPYRSFCQILPTQDRPRGTLRTYTSPRFAFQPTSLSSDHSRDPQWLLCAAKTRECFRNQISLCLGNLEQTLIWIDLIEHNCCKYIITHLPRLLKARTKESFKMSKWHLLLMQCQWNSVL